MTSQHRFVSFYLEEVGGHQALEVRNSLEIKDFSGNRLGTFPREGGEPYSWYLCGCSSDPFAWRAKGPTDFKCRACKRMPEALFACSCGIVSPANGMPHCLWCGHIPLHESHSCRGVGGGLAVFHDTNACPLCGHEPSAVSLGVRERISIDKPLPVTAPAGSPKVEKASPASVGDAPPVPAVQRPQPPPPAPSRPAPASPEILRELPSPRLMKASTLLKVIALLAVIVGGIWIASRQGPYAQGIAALKNGDLRTAILHFEALQRDDPASNQVRDFGQKISGVLRPEADAALQRFYAESAEDIDWARMAWIYDFASKVAPNEKEILARKAYCEAHIAFGQGRHQLALDRYLSALEQQPGWALALNGLGKIYARSGSPFRDFSIARQYYLKAHQADPQFIFPLINLASLSTLEKDWQEAESYLRSALAINANRPSLYRDLGRALSQQRRYAEALEQYQSWLRFEKDPTAITKAQAAISDLQHRM